MVYLSFALADQADVAVVGAAQPLGQPVMRIVKCSSDRPEPGEFHFELIDDAGQGPFGSR